MNETQTLEIVNTINRLPPEKVAEVRDFVMFLHERYAEKEAVETVDYSDDWSEEDLRDVTIASLRYADELEKRGEI